MIYELYLGAQGIEVSELQENLNYVAKAGLTVNGNFDTPTSYAVERYQHSKKLQITGKADPGLRERLQHERSLMGDLPIVQCRPPLTQSISLIAPINNFTGYGQQACNMVRSWIKLGYKIKIRRQLDEFIGPPMSDDLRSLIVADEPQEFPWEFIMWPPFIPTTSGKKTLYFTMWEGTKLCPASLEYLSHSTVVVVPSDWSMSTFSASGLTIPIRKCPLGINTGIFKFTQMNLDEPCTFGAGGRLGHGGCRKGLSEVIECFFQAFPVEEDVRLKIKIFEEDLPNLPKTRDPRITYDSAWICDESLSEWYASLTSFVSLSRGEGFGLMNLQAMSCGRPVVTTKFSGVTEYFDDQVGYVIDHLYAKGEGFYANGGCVAQPNTKTFIKTLRSIYNDRAQARDKGIKASARASKFTVDAFTTQINSIMKEFEMV